MVNQLIVALTAIGSVAGLTMAISNFLQGRKERKKTFSQLLREKHELSHQRGIVYRILCSLPIHSESYRAAKGTLENITDQLKRNEKAMKSRLKT